MSAFLSFEERGSFVERLHPLSKLSLVVGIDSVALAARPPWESSLVGLVGGILLFPISRRSDSLKLLLASLPFLFLQTALVSAFVPGTPLFSLTFLTFSKEGAVAGALASVRILAVLSTSQWFLLTTPPTEILALFSPFPTLSLILGAGVSAVPSLEREIRRMGESARLRGLEARPRTWGKLLPSFSVRVEMRSKTLSEALQTAGFEGKIASRRGPRLKGWDFVVAFVAGALGGWAILSNL